MDSKMSQIFCLYCGKSIKEDSLFCEFCGQPVKDENTANSSAPLYPRTELASLTPSDPEKFHTSSKTPGGGDKLNSYALWSFILSIINLGTVPIGLLVFLPCCFPGLIFFILSLIFAIKGRADIARSEGKERGAGFALWGIILSILSVFFTVILFVIIVLGYYSLGNL